MGKRVELGPVPYPDTHARAARDALKALREERGWSQARAGEALGGLSQATISRLESGPAQIQLATLLEMRRVLRISIDELLGLDPIEWEGVPISDLLSRLDAVRDLILSRADGRNAPAAAALPPKRRRL